MNKEENKEENKEDDDLPEVQISRKHLKSMVTSRKFRSVVELLEDINSVNALITYLNKELGNIMNDELRQALKKNKIDGVAFQSLKDEHIIEMRLEKPLSIGGRLKLLSKTAKVERAVRYQRRKEVILEGNCDYKAKGWPKSIPARWEMTNSNLKFVIQSKENKKETHSYETICDIPGLGGHYITENKCLGRLCCLTHHTWIKTYSQKLVDHIDFTRIDDVDLCATILNTTITTPSCCPLFSPSKTPPEQQTKNIVFISLNLKNIEGMAFSGKDNTETVLEIEIKDEKEAEDFATKLVDMVNEAQYTENYIGIS